MPLGRLDGSMGEPHDAACERALDEVVRESSTRYALPSPPELDEMQRRADSSQRSRCRMWEDVALTRYRRCR